MNFGEIDVTNDKGKAAFRAALLKLADNSLQVLKDTGAQGMITWDPEGEEFLGDCYYGDPRLVPTLAPEMEFKNDGDKSAIDEYFEKFRAAGLKVGVCIRPQASRDGRWQADAPSCRRRARGPDSSGKDRLRKEAMGLHTFLCGFNRDCMYARFIRTFLKQSRTRIPMSC